MQKSNFTVLAVFSKQNRISKCGEKHRIHRKILYQNSRLKKNRIFDPLTMACTLKKFFSVTYRKVPVYDTIWVLTLEYENNSL